MKHKRKNQMASTRQRLTYVLKVITAAAILSTIIILLALRFVIIPFAACPLDKMPPELRAYNAYMNPACPTSKYYHP